MEQPDDKLRDLLTKVTAYHPTANVSLIENAFAYADMAYGDARRLDESLLMDHAYKVAQLLAEIHVDEYTISAGLLHDVIHETDLTIPDIADDFDQNVVNIISGISKIKTYTTKQSEKVYAENLRNLFLATTQDPRVVLIRLAEKLHNIQTVHCLPIEKQRIIAQKAIDIYAPLADLLGVQKYKRGLEDNAFLILLPTEYTAISSFFEAHIGEHNTIVETTVRTITNLLTKVEINHNVFGRIKNYYSTYKKYFLKKYNSLSFEDYLVDLHDKVAFTILCTDTSDCYRALSAIHRTYAYSENEYTDYIDKPKINGYRGIHTTINIGTGLTCEVHIKTHDMHEYNEYGPPSHAYYKLEGREKSAYTKTPEEKIAQIKELIRWKDMSLTQPKTVLSSFQSHIYVFTPKADVIELPKGATPIDFAYRIHTKIGNNMRGAYVNGKFVSINHTLKNGDVCEILTHNGKRKPSPDWLRIAKTASARSQIRKALS